MPNLSLIMAIFNQEAFSNLIDGDRELFAELYRLYNEEWTNIIEDLKVQLALGDANKVASLAHRLKGMTRNFFAAETAALCGEVEDFALSEKLNQIQSKIEPLIISLRALDQALLASLKTF